MLRQEVSIREIFRLSRRGSNIYLRKLERCYNEPMRNDQWLEDRLDLIWNKHFFDIEKKNPILIHFGKKAKTRLGSIRLARSMEQGVRSIEINPPGSLHPAPNSLITITGYFRDEIVPEYVVDLVIAHELCHYAHGFCSSHPQLYKNPHQGKVIDKELYKRGFGEKIKEQKAWLKESWPVIVGLPRKRRIVRRKYAKLNLLKFLNPNF